MEKRYSKSSKTVLILIVVMIGFYSCKNEKTKNSQSGNTSTKEAFNDSSYVLNPSFPVGDVRRYGVFPDSTFVNTHPFTKQSKLETILDLAENYGIEMQFPQGFYNFPLIIKGRKNIILNFKSAELGGIVQIIENDSIASEKISFKGNLTTYGGFFSRKSNDIDINSLAIKSNIEKNINSIESKGCNIYVGSKNISINNLTIDGVGSKGEPFKYTPAALAIHGWNDNPINVQIKNIHIISTDRHGIYITGKDHLIGDVVIDKFGIGSSEGMDGMQDAQKGEEKDFKALWVNKCYDSFIENITINTKDSKGRYIAHFDAGDMERPFTIGKFRVVNNNPKIDILEEDGHGVIIEVMDKD